MLTDTPPRKNRADFLQSDRVKSLDVPQNGTLLEIAKRLDSAIKSDRIADVRSACAEFLATASGFYRVPTCGVRVLAARPLRVRERWTFELFGDYDGNPFASGYAPHAIPSFRVAFQFIDISETNL